jgi:hypothetical protein
MLHANRLFFPEGRPLDAVGTDPSLNQGLPDGYGTLYTERQVVPAGSAIVAVPLDDYARLGVLKQELKVIVQCLLLVWRNCVSVIVKQNRPKLQGENTFSRTRRCG